jgi:hypothetical protein
MTVTQTLESQARLARIRPESCTAARRGNRPRAKSQRSDQRLSKSAFAVQADEAAGQLLAVGIDGTRKGGAGVF